MMALLIAIGVWGWIRFYMSCKHDKRTKQLTDIATENYRRKSASERDGNSVILDTLAGLVPDRYSSQQTAGGISSPAIVG